MGKESVYGNIKIALGSARSTCGSFVVDRYRIDVESPDDLVILVADATCDIAVEIEMRQDVRCPRYTTFMLFGAHVSIAGGVENAPLNAAKIGCDVFQIFSRSPRGGAAPKLGHDTLTAFFQNCKETGMREWVVHAPYYLNFASGNVEIRKASIRVLREELERGSLLKAKYVMFHPGSARDVGKTQAMTFVTDGLKHVLKNYRGSAQLLIEVSAGAGMVIGNQFEEVAAILERDWHRELGVCFDTAHVFASGYDLRTKKAVWETLRKFDQTIGLERLKMTHLNDSKVDIGEKRDRHEHLGKGYIGKEGFRALLTHPKFSKLNGYLETEPDKIADDLALLKKFRFSL